MVNSLSDTVFSLVQVVLIDLALAGDNLVVVATAASRVRQEWRAKVILWGLVGAAGIRMVLATLIVQILPIIGLTLAGGLLLLSVSWKLGHDLARGRRKSASAIPPQMPMRSAIVSIVLADLSMSLDNVLAVAGAAHNSHFVLVVGILLSIGFVAFFAHFAARIMERHVWVSWLGVALIVYVAFDMIVRGLEQVRGFA
jgi:YjbE family integral membrane protein